MQFQELVEVLEAFLPLVSFGGFRRSVSNVIERTAHPFEFAVPGRIAVSGTFVL